MEEINTCVKDSTRGNLHSKNLSEWISEQNLPKEAIVIEIDQKENEKLILGRFIAVQRVLMKIPKKCK